MHRSGASTEEIAFQLQIVIIWNLSCNPDYNAPEDYVKKVIKEYKYQILKHLPK